jgi:hypothetical protein
MTGEGNQQEQRREEQKFFPIITRQNKFDEPLRLLEKYKFFK